MYITAQRVYARSTGESGINAFIYFHDDRPYPTIDWNKPDVFCVAQSLPGRFVDQDRDIQLPGNEVLSYLDVVTSDSTEVVIIEQAMQAFLDRDLLFQTPPHSVISGVAIHFYVTFGLREGSVQAYREEYRVLMSRVRRILDTHRVP